MRIRRSPRGLLQASVPVLAALALVGPMTPALTSATATTAPPAVSQRAGDDGPLALYAPKVYETYAFGGRVWQLQGAQTDGQWTSPLGDRPFLNGSSPFYPR